MNKFQIENMGLWIKFFFELKIESPSDFFIELMEIEEQLNDRIPFISNHGFVQFGIVVECITLFKVIYDKIGTVKFLSTNQKKVILSIFARIINERFRYVDLNLEDEDLNNWHNFINKHGLYHWNGNDVDFEEIFKL